MTIAEINTLAEAYANEYNPNKEAPFPYANVLAKNPELKVYYFDPSDEKMSGATLYKDGKFSIIINVTKPENRQHFTLGHELGHYFLHKDILREHSGLIDGDNFLDGSKILYRLDDDTQRNRIEREANHFAASLLMPSELVREAWKAESNIEKVATIFKVSTVAMSIRLSELGLVS